MAMSDQCRQVKRDEHKLLLIVNESNDAYLTLYIYPAWAPLCLLSMESKIIKPNEKYLYRSESDFKFKLAAKIEDKCEMKKLLKPQKWIKNLFIKVKDSLECTTEDLANFPEEKRICLRKLNRKEELGGRLNFYAVLGLNMEEVRKMEIKDLKKAVEKGFRQQILIWHPDKNFGDDEIARQIIVAREILLNDARRTLYHNEVDYDTGWLSLRRYKAVFWPESFTEEQNKAYWRKLTKIAVPFTIAIFGIAISLSMGPAGSILGTGLTAAGLQSLGVAMSRNSVVDECDWMEMLSKALIGFVGGVITGGAATCITAGMGSLASNALTSAAVKKFGNIGMGMTTGAIGGITSSLASDATRKLVNNEDVTAKQSICHVISRAVIGAAAGAFGGLVTDSVLSHQASSAASKGLEVLALQGAAKKFTDQLALEVSREFAESGSKAIMETAAQIAKERLDDTKENQHPKKYVASSVGNLAECGVTAIIKGGLAVAESQTKAEFNREQDEDAYLYISVKDDCVKHTDKDTGNSWSGASNDDVSISFEPENTEKPTKQSPYMIHGTKIENEIGRNDSTAIHELAYDGSPYNMVPQQVKDTLLSGPLKGMELSQRNICLYPEECSDELEEDYNSDEGMVDLKPGRDRINFSLKHKKHTQHESKESDNILFADVNPQISAEMTKTLRTDKSPKICRKGNARGNEEKHDLIGNKCDEREEYEQVTITYISKIPGVSKMIVKYCLNDDEKEQEVKGSGKKVTVPYAASKVEVRFKARRGLIWWDILKYDRFKKKWCHPHEAHVFHYETARNRTFTISGNLLGAVTRVSDEYHEEIEDM